MVKGRAGKARRSIRRDSRDAVFRAAAAEFAERGYEAAGVDRIAAKARVNKAMIYYHFKSKAALYREILQDMFGAVGERVRAVAASDAPPDRKIRQFIEAIADEAAARPHFPPIWVREIAEGTAHVDQKTLRYARGVLATLTAMIEEGQRAGRFVQVNPLLVHAGIVGPLIFFLATAGLRRKLEQAGVEEVRGLDRERLIAHVERMTLAVLEGRL